MARDYYLILGLSSDATLDQIKSAHRTAAKKCHPDHSGGGSEPFLAIQEAYEALCDPRRRRAYDDELAREKLVRRATSPARPQGRPTSRCPVEPLVPDRRPLSPRDAFPDASLSSLFEGLFRRPWSSPGASIGPAAGRRSKDIHFEFSLTREEALHGGQIRIWVPLQVRCPACRGRGGTSFFECLHCHGRGTVESGYPIDIAFPGGLVDGSTGSVSLDRPGMGDLSLTLHFRVTKR